MMSFIVVDGDGLNFTPNFGARLVTIPAPGKIQGSGQATIGSKKVCIVGDESKVRVSATYTTPSHTTQGAGTVTIMKLDASQQAPGCTNGAVLITKGSQFTALFTVESPAMIPGTPPVPDTSPPSQGQGTFITQQNVAMAGSN